MCEKSWILELHVELWVFSLSLSLCGIGEEGNVGDATASRCLLQTQSTTVRPSPSSFAPLGLMYREISPPPFPPPSLALPADMGGIGARRVRYHRSSKRKHMRRCPAGKKRANLPLPLCMYAISFHPLQLPICKHKRASSIPQKRGESTYFSLREALLVKGSFFHAEAPFSAFPFSFSQN